MRTIISPDLSGGGGDGPQRGGRGIWITRTVRAGTFVHIAGITGSLSQLPKADRRLRPRNPPALWRISNHPPGGVVGPKTPDSFLAEGFMPKRDGLGTDRDELGGGCGPWRKKLGWTCNTEIRQAGPAAGERYARALAVKKTVSLGFRALGQFDSSRLATCSMLGS